ncbi:MAG TPA: hypothetical protein VGH53_04595 [Streptosporangiaceae bacterium]
MSSRGGIQVAGQRIQVGFSYARQTVTVELGDTNMRIIDPHGELITTVPRNSSSEISRFKACETRTGPVARYTGRVLAVLLALASCRRTKITV